MKLDVMSAITAASASGGGPSALSNTRSRSPTGGLLLRQFPLNRIALAPGHGRTSSHRATANRTDTHANGLKDETAYSGTAMKTGHASAITGVA